MSPGHQGSTDLRPLNLIVLAAGASTRLGQAKALAQLGPCTALEHLLNSWEAAGESLAKATVVLGGEFARIAPRVPAPVRALENPNWALGRTGSLQRAIEASPPCDALVSSVDTPLVAPRTLRILLEAWRSAGCPARGWLAPATSPNPDHPARPGHPILIGRDLLQVALNLGPDEPLRDLRDLAKPLFLEVVQDPAIHDDLDTPLDLHRLQSRFPMSGGN